MAMLQHDRSPVLFMRVNRAGGRFWIVLLRGLLSAKQITPPGFKMRRASFTNADRADWGHSWAMKLKVTMSQDASG